MGMNQYRYCSGPQYWYDMCLILPVWISVREILLSTFWGRMSKVYVNFCVHNEAYIECCRGALIKPLF